MLSIRPGEDRDGDAIRDVLEEAFGEEQGPGIAELVAGLQADDTAPVEYEPTERGVIARYANGVKLVMRDKDWLGLGTCSVRFEGDEGWVEAGEVREAVYDVEVVAGEVRTVRHTFDEAPEP